MNNANVGLEAVLDSYYDYLGCKKCDLCTHRVDNDVLSGFGSATADIMVITDSPSMEDYSNRELFSDQNGKLFLNLLEMVWYEEDKEMDKIRDYYGERYWDELREYLSTKVFFTTLVACPTEDKVKVSDTQAKACRQRVYDLIYAVDPLIIIGLGDVVKKHIFNVKGEVKKIRGAVKEVEIPSRFSNRTLRYAGMLTHHPRILGMVGDQAQVPLKRGITYESMQDVTKALTIVKTHKELQND